MSNLADEQHGSNPSPSPVTDDPNRRFAARDGRLVRLLSRLPAFRSTVKKPEPTEVGVAFLASLTIEALAIWARFAVDPYLPAGFPYLTFFPAVILTGFVFGMRPAILNACISAIVAWYWFIPPAQSFDLNAQSFTALAFFFFVIAIDLGLLMLLLSAYAEQQRAKEDLTRHLQMQQLISDEVDHRLKNLLATTSGLITLSQRYAATPQELGTQLRNRIQAMGHSISLLRGSLSGEATSMRDTILSALEPLGLTSGDRLSLEGPTLKLNASSIISLSLILHELGTNAFKYGALAQDRGSIKVRWEFCGAPDEADRDESWLQLIWEEHGAIGVEAPTRSGFGTDLVRRLATGFGAPCSFEYRSDGLRAVFPMRRNSTLVS
ncbi:DUF4118 domain-containing protein [Rhizobium lemnae]|uniref:histidine kinase n=1 Tax=Rhizobium lemnae TaxID=1214924 RepID=A0ABV8EBI5_9HYPH|nr:DUF4118 domain-containing protein [Rhizobium lemnae]MCJ8506358.1 DUF4118 domain-containing protein [Rhizobium lemnae]